MSEPAEDCVEAIPWLPSLTADDWQFLRSVWTERSVDWRANCACIVGQGPVTPSQPVLRRANARGDAGTSPPAPPVGPIGVPSYGRRRICKLPPSRTPRAAA